MAWTYAQETLRMDDDGTLWCHLTNPDDAEDAGRLVSLGHVTTADVPERLEAQLEVLRDEWREAEAFGRECRLTAEGAFRSAVAGWRLN